MSGVFFALLFLTAAYDYASAFYCSEPDAPYCATRYSPFDDGYEFERCKRDMENFRSETEDYLECLKDESDDAVEAYEEAVSSFNRRVRGY